jgi:hypothetical protein
MPLILGVVALLTPRLLIVLVWFLTGWFNGLFRTALVPVLGFIFLPTTFLWYTVVLHWWRGQWTLWPVVGMVIALCIDLAPGSTRRRYSDD